MISCVLLVLEYDALRGSATPISQDYIRMACLCDFEKWELRPQLIKRIPMHYTSNIRNAEGAAM